MLILLSVLIGAIRFKLDLDRKAAAPERPVEFYVYAHKQTGDVYLTPVKLQDFRLETGAPVFVEFKSIPYQDMDVIEWQRRELLADQFYKTNDCESLIQFRDMEGVTHAVLPASSQAVSCAINKEIYRDEYYVLVQLTR